MQAYCYAYYYSMPSSFDAGSAVPCIDLAVQSLTTTYQGDDGKYYQTDIIGDRDGEIRFGGRGVFDGSRAVSFDDLTGVTIANYEGTSTPTISGNTVNFTTGYLDYLELSNGSKYYFENFDNETLYDVSDNALHGTLSAGSAIDWQTQEEGIYSHWDNYGGNLGYIGEDVVVNGDFEDGTNDFTFNSPITFTTNASNQAVISRNNGGVADFPRQTCLESGKQYRITFDVIYLNARFSVYLGGTEVYANSVGTYSFIVTASGTDLVFGPTSNAAATCIVDNIVIEEYYEDDVVIPALESDPTVDIYGTPNANQGRVKFNAEMHSSCLVTDGTQQFSTDGFINMAEDEDFYYPFKFSLSGTVKDYETLFVIENSIYLFTNRVTGGSKPNFLIKQNNNSLYSIVFPSNLPRDGSLITGFVRKIGDQATLCFNGVEETKTLTNPSKAITNGVIELFGDDSGLISLMKGECYNIDIAPHFKSDFSDYAGATIYNLYEKENANLSYGSSVGIWDLSPYAYPRNNTLGFGRAGDAFTPIELGGSCLVMNGTDNSITINESCGLGYDEDFHYIFEFSLSESTNYHECLFNIQSDTYYGGSMFLYVKYGDIPEFRIMKKVNSSYLTYILSFPDELPRDGSKISGFVKKEGSIITMSFNGVEVSADFPGEVPAYENDVTTIGTSDSGMSSAFLTGKLFYLDIAPIFKSTFSDFSGSTIENMYEDKSAGILSGSSLSAWEISKLAVTYTGTNIGLNGSESEYKDPYVFELIETCNSLAPNFRFSDTESLLWGYDDIEGNVQDLNFMFSDVNTNTPVKDNTTTYSEALTGDCLAKANEYFKTT